MNETKTRGLCRKCYSRYETEVGSKICRCCLEKATPKAPEPTQKARTALQNWLIEITEGQPIEAVRIVLYTEWNKHWRAPDAEKREEVKALMDELERDGSIHGKGVVRA